MNVNSPQFQLITEKTQLEKTNQDIEMKLQNALDQCVSLNLDLDLKNQVIEQLNLQLESSQVCFHVIGKLCSYGGRVWVDDCSDDDSYVKFSDLLRNHCLFEIMETIL